MATNRISTRERLRHLDYSLTSRLQRVRKRFIFIVQAAFGAGLAFWVAQTFFGHAVPFFAPISVVVAAVSVAVACCCLDVAAISVTEVVTWTEERWA